MSALIISAGVFTFVIVPLLIFCARICDMSLDTIRVIFMSKGIKYLPSFIGFFEVIIWLVAIGQVMNNLTNAVCYIAYGAGFPPGRLSAWLSRRNCRLALRVTDHHKGRSLGPDTVSPGPELRCHEH